jgi:hypothetical protein
MWRIGRWCDRRLDEPDRGREAERAREHGEQLDAAPASTSASSASAAPAASGNGGSTSKSTAAASVPEYKPSSIVSKYPG